MDGRRPRPATDPGLRHVGANGTRSCAAGYPEPHDLGVAASVEVDLESGEFVLDDGGRARLTDGGLLVRWEQVACLAFVGA